MYSQVVLPLSLITIDNALNYDNIEKITDNDYIQISRILISMYKSHVLKTHKCNTMTGGYVDYNRQLFVKSEKIMSLCMKLTHIKNLKNNIISTNIILKVLNNFKTLRQNIGEYCEYLYDNTSRNPHIYDYISDNVDLNVETIIEELEEYYKQKCVNDWFKDLNILCINDDNGELRDSISINELKNSFEPYKHILIKENSNFPHFSIINNIPHIPDKITLTTNNTYCRLPYNIPNCYNHSSTDKKEYSGIIYNCSEELLDFADYVENYKFKDKDDKREEVSFFEKRVKQYLHKDLFIPHHHIKYIHNKFRKSIKIHKKDYTENSTIIDWYGLVVYIRNTLSKKKFILRYMVSERNLSIKKLELI